MNRSPLSGAPVVDLDDRERRACLPTRCATRRSSPRTARGAGDGPWPGRSNAMSDAQAEELAELNPIAGG